MKNVGKIFESAFKTSVPDYCLVQRLNDPPAVLAQGKIKGVKFAKENPCDYLIFNCKQRILYAIECKTTSYRSFSYEDINIKEQSRKMIHKHQIIELDKFSAYDYVIAGFLFNFRDEEHNMERTYFQDIRDFMKMYNSLDKSSCNEIDLLMNGAIKIDGQKKRVNYQWDIESLFQKIEERRM